MRGKYQGWKASPTDVIRLRMESKLWLVLALLTLVVGLDSRRVPGVSQTQAAVVYSVASMLLVMAWWTQELAVTRWAVSATFVLGVVRSGFYFFDDGRIVPLALNLQISLLLWKWYTIRRKVLL
jgi:hypothetical protein